MSKLKEIWQYVPEWYKIGYWVCLITAIVLLLLGFFAIPVGSIEPSVLTGAGIMFAFASLGIGGRALEKGVDAKVTHGETSLELNNPDSKKEEN